MSLLFFQVSVAAEGDSVVDATTDGWSLASGTRFSLFVTGVGVAHVSPVVFVAGGVLGLVGGVGSEFGGVVDTGGEW